MAATRDLGDPMATIGEQIRRGRVDHGWTQADLAEHAGLSRPTIARIERGDDVSTATLAKAAVSLGLTLTVAPDVAEKQS